MEGFTSLKTRPFFPDARKNNENSSQLFTEMEWSKCFPFPAQD